MVESTWSVLLEQLEKGAAVTHLEKMVAKPASLPPMENVTSLVEASR